MEFICLNHPPGTKGRRIAEAWWKERSAAPVPFTVMDDLALIKRGTLAEPRTLTLVSKPGEKYSERGERVKGLFFRRGRDAQVPANALDCSGFDFPVPGNTGAACTVGIAPVFMFALAMEITPMFLEMPVESLFFHGRLFPGLSCRSRAALPARAPGRDLSLTALDKCRHARGLGERLLKRVSLGIDARDVLAGDGKAALVGWSEPKQILAAHHGKRL